MSKYRGVRFDVFSHPTTNAKFGIGEAADKSTVVIDIGATTVAASVEKASRTAAIRAMGDKLKRGYAKADTSMYFDVVEQVFTHVHPDLYWGGKKWVLASNPPSLDAGINAVAAAMAQVDTTLISPAEVKAWSTRQQLNDAYMVAFDDMPIWSLVVAQTAMQFGWPVRANPNMRGAPAHLPSTNPGEWDAWLQQVFAVNSIQEARGQLGYAVGNKSKPDHQQLVDEENWSSLI